LIIYFSFYSLKEEKKRILLCVCVCVCVPFFFFFFYDAGCCCAFVRAFVYFCFGRLFFFTGTKRNETTPPSSFLFLPLLTGEIEVDYRGASVLYVPLKTIPITL
jgi:hypothetical protein